MNLANELKYYNTLIDIFILFVYLLLKIHVSLKIINCIHKN